MRLMSPQEQAAELGVRIRRERLRQNLSQATLGRRAGVGRLTVTRMESGENTNLTNFLAVLSALRRSGDLENAFHTLAGDMSDEVERSSARLLAVLEPALIVFMFAIIGTLLIALMLPMITLTSKIQL